MPRRPPADPIADAARSLLVAGERVVESGHCWGAQRREHLPLVLARRNQYLMVLTDRRMLLFSRRSGPVQAGDLVIGKRYQTFELDKVHRARPLLQVRVNATTGTRMVFEFRPSRRHVGDALVQRLDRTPIAALPAPATAAAEPPAVPAAPPTADQPATGKAGDDGEMADPTFWGASAHTA
jgi:hypothetical protein